MERGTRSLFLLFVVFSLFFVSSSFATALFDESEIAMLMSENDFDDSASLDHALELASDAVGGQDDEEDEEARVPEQNEDEEEEEDLASSLLKGDDEETSEESEEHSMVNDILNSPELHAVDEEEQEQQAGNDDDDDLEESTTEDKDEDSSSSVDADELDLEEMEAEAQTDQCAAALQCRQQQQDELARLVAQQEDRRQKCEASNAAGYAKAKTVFDACEAAAAKKCAETRDACAKKRSQLAQEAASAGIKAAEVPCEPCTPSGCTLSFEYAQCEPREILSTPKVCDAKCDELCPSQTECETKNSKDVGAFKKALSQRNIEILRCQRDNADSVKLAIDFARKCTQQNADLLSKCAESVDKARKAAQETNKSASLPDVPCPITKCEVPTVTLSKCDFPQPKAPQLATCTSLCNTSPCIQRTKCERSNTWLLRRISHFERVFHACEMRNKKKSNAAIRKVQTCEQKRIKHLAVCQVHRGKAVLSAHDRLQKCINSTPASQWVSKCYRVRMNAPKCGKFECHDETTTTTTTTTTTVTSGKNSTSLLVEESEDDDEDDDEEQNNNASDTPSAPEDCQKLVAQQTPTRRVLKDCSDLCPETMYSKWRGEKHFDAEVEQYKKSKLFVDYKLYQEHAARCLNPTCRDIARREWRRAIIACPPGEEGAKCRRIRRFKGAMVRHQVELIVAYEKKRDTCPAGDAGRTCRRVVTEKTREKLHACPASQSHTLCREFQAERLDKILSKCGPDSERATCRRARRECVKRYSPLRAECIEGDDKCRELSWDLVKKKCYLAI